MKRYHRRRTCSHTSPRCSPTMVRFMTLGLSSGHGGMTAGLWKLSSLDGRLPLWYQPQASGDLGPGVSTLWLDEIKSLICNFYLSVQLPEQIGPRDTQANRWDGRQPATNQPALLLGSSTRSSGEGVREASVQLIAESYGWQPSCASMH